MRCSLFPTVMLMASVSCSSSAQSSLYDDKPLVLGAHLDEQEGEDFLYHFGFTSQQKSAMFQDVKFVLMGGKASRMQTVAEQAARQLGIAGQPQPIGDTTRFSLYKVGPIIAVNHGVGMGSMGLVLDEITKLLARAQATNVTFIRMGSSGGVGVTPGTIVVTQQGLDAELRPFYRCVDCGEAYEWDTAFDPRVVAHFQQFAVSASKHPVVLGSTVGTHDFYRAQGRRDGAISQSSAQKREAFLQKAAELGVKNFEMEGLLFAGFLNQVFKGSSPRRFLLVCTTFLDRLKGDQVVQEDADKLHAFEANLIDTVLAYVMRELKTLGVSPR